MVTRCASSERGGRAQPADKDGEEMARTDKPNILIRMQAPVAR